MSKNHGEHRSVPVGQSSSSYPLTSSPCTSSGTAKVEQQAEVLVATTQHLGCILKYLRGTCRPCSSDRGCGRALESLEGRELAEAFSRGILFVLSVPLGAVGVVGPLIYRS